MEKKSAFSVREPVVVRIGIVLLVLGLAFLGFALFGPLDDVSAQTLPPGVTQVGDSSTVGGSGGSSPDAECADVSNLSGLSLVYYDKSDGAIGTPGDIYGIETMTGGIPTDLSWSTRDPITAVLIKAAPGFNYYIYDPAVSVGSGLDSPKDDSVSHVTFCWLGESEPTATPVPDPTATPVPGATATPVPDATATPVPGATSAPVVPGDTPTVTPVPGATSAPVVPAETPTAEPIVPVDPTPIAPADEVLGQELAFTGRATSGMAIAGFTFLGTGGAFLFAGRRLRAKNRRS